MTAVGVAFEGEVDVMVGALHGGLVVGAQTTMLSGKLSAVGQHMDLGFHYVVVAMPHIANEDHQTCEVRDLAAGQSLWGQKEGRDLKEGIQQHV